MYFSTNDAKCFIFLTFIFNFNGYAQSQDLCASLLAHGIHDTANVISIDSALKRVQGAVCSSDFSTYSSAESASKNFDLNIMKFVSATYDDQTTGSNYQQRINKLCSYNFSDISGNSVISANIRTINGDLVAAFNKCIATVTGFYAYAEPSSDLKKFTLHVKKQGIAKITSFSSSPKLTKCTDGLLGASSSKPVIVNGSAQFICERRTSDSPIVIAGNTQSDGRLFQSTIELPGSGASLAALIERITALEIAKTPRKQVGFFNVDTCPAGWSDVPPYWTGRYVVATVDGHPPGDAVGTALQHGENRPTGAHTHTTSSAFRGGNASTNAAKWDSSGIARSAGQTTNTFEDSAANVLAKNGTNAPYVTLKACIKN